MFWFRQSKKPRACSTSVTVAKVWPEPEAGRDGPPAPSAESRVPDGVERPALCAACVGLTGSSERLTAEKLGMAGGPFKARKTIVCCGVGGG